MTDEERAQANGEIARFLGWERIVTSVGQYPVPYWKRGDRTQIPCPYYFAANEHMAEFVEWCQKQHWYAHFIYADEGMPCMEGPFPAALVEALYVAWQKQASE